MLAGALSTPEYERTGKEVFTLGVKIVPWPNGIGEANVESMLASEHPHAHTRRLCVC